MALFEIETPDKRLIRHVHDGDLQDLQTTLTPGYVVKGEVFGADKLGKGGYVFSADSGGSLMSALLKAYGDELLAWLKAKGFDRDTD